MRGSFFLASTRPFASRCTPTSRISSRRRRMLKPLRTDRRRTLLRCSLFAAAGALLLSPLARPAAEPRRAGSIATPTIKAPDPAESPEPKLVIARDPFVPDAAVQSADAPSEDGGDG